MDPRTDVFGPPCSFVWSTCDVNDTKTVEEVSILLARSLYMARLLAAHHAGPCVSSYI